MLLRASTPFTCTREYVEIAENRIRKRRRTDCFVLVTWCFFQEACPKGHQGDQGIRYIVNGMDICLEGSTEEHNKDKNTDTGISLIYRVPPMFVSIPNWTRRSGKLVSRVFHSDSAYESRESVTTRRVPRRSCTVTSRPSMSRTLRDFTPLSSRMHKWSKSYMAWGFFRSCCISACYGSGKWKGPTFDT